jgi:pimeloyl-ACP methyl ester carboxylesterase
VALEALADLARQRFAGRRAHAQGDRALRRQGRRREHAGEAGRRAEEDGRSKVLARAGEQLSRITAPTLVVWGEKDPYIPSAFAQAYADALPNATAQVIAGAGHWPWLQEPELVQTVSSFLRR